MKEHSFKGSGDDGMEVTLLPIPNRKVKIHSAEGTARETVWEIRTLPGKFKEIVIMTISFLVSFFEFIHNFINIMLCTNLKV